MSTSSRRRRRSPPSFALAPLWSHLYTCMLPDHMVSLPEKLARVVLVTNALRSVLRLTTLFRYGVMGEPVSPEEVLEVVRRNLGSTCASLKYLDVCSGLEKVFSELVGEAVRERRVYAAHGAVSVTERIVEWSGIVDLFEGLVSWCSDKPPTQMVECLTVVCTAFLSVVVPPVPWVESLEFIGAATVSEE